MKIAIATWSIRQAGGVESYVADVAGALVRGGHDVRLWYERDEPAGRPRLVLPASVVVEPLASATPGGTRTSFEPDAVLLNGLEQPDTEAGLVLRHPAVFVAHNYHGTCISGTKTWSRPDARACDRAFGARCVATYFPRGCGGRSPATMIRLYRRARRQLINVQGCRAVVTLSEHMRREYLRQGVPPARVHCIPYGPAIRNTGPTGAADLYAPAAERTREVRLLVVARLERPKGVHLALDALPCIATSLGRPVSLTVVGDGRDRPALAAQATALERRRPDVRVQFSGWLSPEDRDRLIGRSDLLVVPSVWAEPFGIVGVEAGRLGLPAVAFDIGGVSQWLADGVNGALAPATPPTAAGLADAAVRCLDGSDHHALLRAGARAMSERFTIEEHVSGLVDVLASVCARSGLAV